MTERSFTTARVAGLLYLVVIVCAGFAQIVRTAVIESGDASATAQNIRDSEWLFRFGFSSDVLAFAADVALALALYVVFKPVNGTLSLLAAFFRLAQAATLGINLLNQFFALLLLSGEDYLTVFDADQIDALVLLFLDAHAYGYLIALVFFALSTLTIAYLVFKSGYIPWFLGVLLVAAAAGYLVDSFGLFLFQHDQETLSLIFVAPAVIGEVAFMLWLLIRGRAVPAERAVRP